MSQASLVKRIEQERIKILESTEQVERLLKKVQLSGDLDYIGTIALHLHSFYNGVEHIFLGVAKSIDNSVPEGEDWHRQLLIQMTLPLPNVRSALVKEQTYQALNEFRGFRHVVRSNYAYELEPERVTTTIDKWGQPYSEVTSAWRRFKFDGWPHLSKVSLGVLALASKLPVASQTLLTDCQQFCQELKSRET